MQSQERQRYRKLLLTKLEKLSATIGKNGCVVPAAGDRHGDLADQANSNSEAELQIRLHQTDGRLMRAMDEALIRLNKDTFGTCVACGQPISKAGFDGRALDAPLPRLQGEARGLSVGKPFRRRSLQMLAFIRSSIQQILPRCPQRMRRPSEGH